MARQWLVNGETLVKVQGPPGSGISELQELGLAEKKVTIRPKYSHKDIHIDDFGPDVPADVLANIAECLITMTLVNLDQSILDICLALSLGGATTGTMPGAGILLGGSLELYEGGNRYIGLLLESPVNEKPWFFPAAYLMNPPMEMPLGTEKSLVSLVWRAIPYQIPEDDGEVVSLDAVLWSNDFEIEDNVVVLN